MRYTGPKNRLARREGVDLELKTPGTKSHAALLKKLNIIPGQHGARNRRKTSEYGRQLREKQKLRYIFGLTENQLKNYFNRAINKTGNTGLYLSQYLEKRLDNVVFRAGFAPTRASARQLISHNHFKVNDKIVGVPSYQVKPGDIIAFAKEKSQKLPVVETVINKKDTTFPAWIERKGTVGKLITEPTSEIIEKQIDLRLVIEFYSR